MPDKTTNNTITAEPSTGERVQQALTDTSQTVAEIAHATDLGRSTVGKQLAAL